MPLVLTTASTVLCGPAVPTPPAHGGTVSTSSSAKLKIGGNAVLVESSVAGQPISGCTTPNDASKGLITCLKAGSLLSGRSSKLQVDNAPVLLDSLAGTTLGTPAGSPPNTPPTTPAVPPGTLPATAGQTKLTAS